MTTNGKIFLVGLGPGDVEHMTGRARDAIAQADTVIGYSTYIKLVTDLLEGKEVIRKGMTEELDRCHEALERARQGKTVALVSSGDSGVYGMAGPTFEVLFESGWHPGDSIEVEVVPGSSAVTACAALVGAPLTHDACTISLSDLLTPWPTIAARLDAAGKADFVIALYNPKSGRRTGQIVEAQRILLCHRAADTPVALVKSGYRRRQQIQLTTLDQMAECDIGMLTTVIIGNSHTFVRDGIMVTPRGYANKYAGRDALHTGERAGRSLSMGLTGWQDYVRAMAIANPDRSMETLAQEFAMPLADVLAAFAIANETDIVTRRLLPCHHDALLDAVMSYSPLPVFFRNEQGSSVSLTLNSLNTFHDGKRKQLRLGSASVAMNLPLDQIRQIWLQWNGPVLQYIYWLSEAGHGVARFGPAAMTELQDLASGFEYGLINIREPETEEMPDDA